MKSTFLFAAIRIVMLVAVIFAAIQYVAKPYRCNIEERRVQNSTETALRADATSAAMIARRNIDRLAPCHGIIQCDVALPMLIAANDQILNRPRDAELLYQEGLRYDRRPELYLNLGIVQLQQHKLQEALHHLYLAARFDRAMMYDGSIPPAVLTTIQNRVAAEEARIRRSQSH